VLVGQVMTETIIIPYRFRSIVDADLPMMEQWLKAPEVARWWGDRCPVLPPMNASMT
jgi:hypothetical protein